MQPLPITRELAERDYSDPETVLKLLGVAADGLRFRWIQARGSADIWSDWVDVRDDLFACFHKKAPTTPSTREEQRLFAIALSLCLAVGTFAVMTWAPDGNSWWVLLTVMVVLAPGYGHTLRRALERSAGTVAGGVVIALAVLWIDNSTVLSILGLIAAIATAITFAAPYWSFAFFLTMAVMLLMNPAEDALYGSMQRIGYTLIAALAVVVLASVLTVIARRLNNRASAAGASEDQTGSAVGG